MTRSLKIYLVVVAMIAARLISTRYDAPDFSAVVVSVLVLTVVLLPILVPLAVWIIGDAAGLGGPDGNRRRRDAEARRSS